MTGAANIWPVSDRTILLQVAAASTYVGDLSGILL